MGGGRGNVFEKAANVGTLGLYDGAKNAFGGAQKLGTGGQFAMTKNAALGEREAIDALRAQASGAAPSIAGQQFALANQQAQEAGLAQAASARGVNPGLAFRGAVQATQQAQSGAAMQSAMMAEEERRMAQQALIQAAAAQRGVALGGAQANLAAQDAYRKQTFDFLGNLGGSAAKASSGGMA